MFQAAAFVCLRTKRGRLWLINNFENFYSVTFLTAQYICCEPGPEDPTEGSGSPGPYIKVYNRHWVDVLVSSIHTLGSQRMI